MLLPDTKKSRGIQEVEEEQPPIRVDGVKRKGLMHACSMLFRGGRKLICVLQVVSRESCEPVHNKSQLKKATNTEVPIYIDIDDEKRIAAPLVGL
jgi:hypothetical protein